MDVGESLRSHAETRIAEAVSKYFDGGYSGHVTVEREGSGFRSDCVLHLDSGVEIAAEARAQDPHQSFDRAAERVEKRLRRYKRRLKDHHPAGSRGESEAAAAYVLAAPDQEAEVPADYSPVIIAEENTRLDTLSVGNAVAVMDMSDVPVVVFRSAAHGGINVVYRRKDGNIGWIDPSLKKPRAAS